MKFYLKCSAHHIFSRIPFGNQVNYLVQRYIAKSLPVDDDLLNKRLLEADQHIENYRSLFNKFPRNMYEFGSGWDLCLALRAVSLGIKVVATDIKYGLKKDLMNDLFRRLNLGDASRNLLTYRAPCNASDTQIKENFDLIISNAVMEHIPSENIFNIMTECYRLLNENGICSFWIDYSDHWHYADQSLQWNNFYRFNKSTWKIFNPKSHFQNRLRNSDYVILFEQAGFNIIKNTVIKSSKPLFKISPEFEKYSDEDLAISGAWFILKKKEKNMREHILTRLPWNKPLRKEKKKAGIMIQHP